MKQYDGPVVFSTIDEFCDVWDLTLPGYNASFVAAFKKRIPPEFRDWDPQGKKWSISEKYLAVAEELVVEYYPGAEIERCEP